MPYAYDSGLIERVMPRVRQWESTTGRRIQPSMLDALIKGQLDTESKRASSERAYDIQEQQLADNKQAQDKAAKAANVKGYVDAATTIGTGALTYKALTKPTAMEQYLASQKATTAGAQAATTGGAQTAVAGTGTAVGDASAMAAYDASLAEGAAQGVGSTAGTSGSAAGAGEGAGAAGLGTAATIAGYAYAGYEANKLMKDKVGPWAKTHIGDNWDTHGFNNPGAAAIGDIAGKISGEETGRKVANVLDPAGNVIVQSTENIADKTGTIICGELHRQGIITDRQRRYGMVYGRMVGNDVYNGYLIAADPVVDRMRKSKLYTKFVSLLAIPTLNEIAHRIDIRKKGSILGCIVLHFGIPYCIKKREESPYVVAEVA